MQTPAAVDTGEAKSAAHLEKPLKIAIFGSGFLGCRFARLACEAGHSVSALTRNPQRASELWAMGVKNVAENLLHEDAWHERFAEPEYDLVVNCVSSAGGGMDGYRLSYLDGMESIFRWCKKGHHVRHFVYTSATSVYPQVNGELVAETDVPDTLTPSGQLLLEAENLVSEGSRLGHFDRATVLRLGAIYGPGRHHLLDQLRSGQTTFPGGGDFILNHIHVDDAVAAIYAAHSRHEPAPQYSVYNVTDSVYPTKAEVLQWIAGQLEIDPESIAFDPESQTARAMRRQVPGFGSGTMPNRRVDCSLIASELGWKPAYPSFREGYAGLLRG